MTPSFSCSQRADGRSCPPRSPAPGRPGRWAPHSRGHSAASASPSAYRCPMCRPGIAARRSARSGKRTREGRRVGLRGEAGHPARPGARARARAGRPERRDAGHSHPRGARRLSGLAGLVDPRRDRRGRTDGPRDARRLRRRAVRAADTPGRVSQSHRHRDRRRHRPTRPAGTGRRVVGRARDRLSLDRQRRRGAGSRRGWIDPVDWPRGSGRPARPRVRRIARRDRMADRLDDPLRAARLAERRHGGPSRVALHPRAPRLVLGAIARSTAALAASGVWGYAEATRFYIVPDVLIGWVALHGTRPRVWTALAATPGAVLGGAAVHRDAAAQHARLCEIPGISSAMLDDAAERFARHGRVAVVRAPPAGIPYKGSAAQSALHGRPLEELVLWTPPARLWRFLLIAVGAGVFGTIFARAIRRRETEFLVAYLAIWAITYARYYAGLRRRYGG